MFENLLDKLKNKKVPKKHQETSKEKDDQEIILSKDDDILQMSILGKLSLHTFFEKVRELAKEDQDVILKLPLSVLANSNQEVNPGNYIWTTIENNKYIIMSNKKKITINQTKKLSDKIEERSVSINTMTNTFTVYKAIHDNDYSTLEHKRFDSNKSHDINYINFNFDDFILSPEEAKSEVDILFDDLINEEKIFTKLKDIIEINNIKSMIDDYFSQRVTNKGLGK